MNILVLTSVYPQSDDEKNIGVTPVVEYFSEEWVKQGHRVLVIHNSSYYPKFIYLLPDKIIKKINSKFGIVIPNKEQSKTLNTIKNGVSNYRLPILKIIPKKIFTKRQIEKQFNNIESILSDEKFAPDIAIGHWENPQIQLLTIIKEKWSIKTSLVFHGLVYLNQKRYLSYLKDMINSLDVIGARSKAIANQVKSILNLKDDPFICNSGMPDRYFNIDENLVTLINNKKTDSYLFVGRLIKRKNVKTILLALNDIYINENFVFNIIGDGGEKDNLFSITSNLQSAKNINFAGYRNREEVIQFMSMTEVFIMISDNETFGLVYIEAMSQGCIVIASKDGGMDGIIKNGINGFLCEQGNKNELVHVCNIIRNMPKEEKKQIALNAIKTAYKFSDSNVAKDYLNNVLQQHSISD
jgi:L-malate glycosyltransferase